MSDIEEAKDKVMMGAERRSMVMTEDDKKLNSISRRWACNCCSK